MLTLNMVLVVILGNIQSIHVENGGGKNKERGISPLQNTFKETRNYLLTNGIIMPRLGSVSSALR